MTHPRTPIARRAFTLIEILVVVAIVAVLVAITTVVGTAVIDSGKKRATQGVLQTLDAALAAYMDQKGEKPPALVPVSAAQLPEDIRNQMPTINGRRMPALFPALDGRAREDNASELIPVNSVAYFIESVKTVPSTQDIIDSINPRFLQNYSPDENFQPFLLTAFDAWGNPIRYVHPKFDGIIEQKRRSLGDPGSPVHYEIPAKGFFTGSALPPRSQWVRLRLNVIRRNRLIDADFGDDGLSGGGGLNMGALSDFDLLPDSDGGLTAGDRPYFYSAGPDGNPATLEDNIYLTPVQHADPGIN